MSSIGTFRAVEGPPRQLSHFGQLGRRSMKSSFHIEGRTCSCGCRGLKQRPDLSP